MAEGVHERCRRGTRERWSGVAGRRLVHDTIDAAETNRRLQLAGDDLIAQVLGDVGPVLDEPTIHIHDVEGAVRSAREIDRPEPFVDRREELCPVIRLSSPEGRAVVVEHDAAYEIRRRLRHEDVPLQVRRQAVPPVDRRCACGRERRQGAILAENAVLIGPIGPRRLTCGPHGVDVTRLVYQDVVAAAPAQEVGVPREVRRGHEVDVQNRLVVVPEDTPGVVLRHSPLAA